MQGMACGPVLARHLPEVSFQSGNQSQDARFNFDKDSRKKVV
jgi:hypothetical protein